MARATSLCDDVQRAANPVFISRRRYATDVDINGGRGGSSDLGGAKQSPLTASMVRSSAIFMCGTSADVTSVGNNWSGKNYAYNDSLNFLTMAPQMT
jgi:hypothetical protein